MSEKVDAILASGCLEKLLEEDAPTIADEAAMSAYLGENGFSDVSELDLALIKGEMAKLIEAEAALDEAGAGVKGKAKRKAKRKARKEFRKDKKQIRKNKRTAKRNRRKGRQGKYREKSTLNRFKRIKFT